MGSEAQRRDLGIADHAIRQIEAIRTTMDRTAQFTAISGRGAIFLGVLALGTVFVGGSPSASDPARWLWTWLACGIIGFVVGVGATYFKARASEQPLFGVSGRRFMFGLLPALGAGAFLSGVFLQLGAYSFLPGVWLLLYGLGVVAAGANSVVAVRAMGISFMLLSVPALLGPEAWGMPLLAVGFGVIHIATGVWIVRNYGG